MEKETQIQTDTDVEEILRLALRQGEDKSGDLRERLSMSAQELGISPDALAKAEEAWRVQKAEELKAQAQGGEFAAFRKSRMDGLRSHLTTYFIINIFLVAVNLITSPQYLWAIWSILGWGISIAIHLSAVLWPNSDNERREFEDWKRRRTNS